MLPPLADECPRPHHRALPSLPPRGALLHARGAASRALRGLLRLRRCPSPSRTITAPEIEAAVSAITRETIFKDGAIGIAVLDVDSGHYRSAFHEHDPLNPASNAKLYTAAAALATLHGNHRYETTLSGRVKGTVVAGPLVLRGYGDPSLRSADLWDLAQDLKTRGIRKIEGDILVDQRFFDEQTTPPAFEQQPNEWAAFRAPVSAVAVNENTITMTRAPDVRGQPGAIVTFDPPGFVDQEGTIQSTDAGGGRRPWAWCSRGRTTTSA